MTDNKKLSLLFLGVGNAQAIELGSSNAVLIQNQQPWLMIDCGPEGLTAFLNHFKALPSALFITHTHFDHVGGLERLFYRAYFETPPNIKIKLFVPAKLIPLLQERVANYPNVLAEGGANFWDAFQLIPVDTGFWYEQTWFDVFAVRHHAPHSAFGLALHNAFVWTGDTRPIPEILEHYGAGNELIAHDCGLLSNPSHTGLDDLAREYSPAVRQRLRLYHYGSLDDAEKMRAEGYAVVNAMQELILN